MQLIMLKHVYFSPIFYPMEISLAATVYREDYTRRVAIKLWETILQQLIGVKL